MKRYLVSVAPAVQKQLKRIPKNDSQKILKKINSLSLEPRPHGYKELVGYKGFFRVRVGNYRIIYNIHDQILTVYVLEVTDRRDAY